MDEKARERVGEWLCGKLNPPGWPILRIEMRAMMLDLYRQGKMDELQKCIQAATEEHKHRTAYLEELKKAEEEKQRFGRPLNENNSSTHKPAPEWVASMPTHPVVQMRRVLQGCVLKFWKPLCGPLEYHNDPRQHIFN